MFNLSSKLFLTCQLAYESPTLPKMKLAPPANVNCGTEREHGATTGLVLFSSSATHVGMRRANNEDRYFADDALGLYVVCDGIGGHADGELAAQTAIDSFVASIRAGVPFSDAPTKSNEAVTALQGPRRFNQLAPGSTIVALRIQNGVAEWGAAGDSDLIRFRGGEVEVIAPHHDSLYGLTNFCGIGQGFNVCTSKTSARPSDRFLLASDGLARHFDLKRSDTVRAFLSEPTLRPDVAECLVALCNERGGKDNITVIVVEVRS